MKFFITSLTYLGSFVECSDCQNSHLNNLVGATTKDVEGWDVIITSGQFEGNIDTYYISCGNGNAWYGFIGGTSVGSISTTLHGCGNGTLNFGNCWSNGNVIAYLDGNEIGKVSFLTTYVIFGAVS